MYNRRLKVKFDVLSVQSQYSSVTVMSDLVTPWTAKARPPCPSPTPGACSNSCPSSWWCCPSISSSYHPLFLLPSVFPRIRIFSCESILPIRWPKYWSLSFSISPSNEYSGLTSFRIDGFEIHEVHGTLKSLLQHHSSKSSIRLDAHPLPAGSDAERSHGREGGLTD